MTTCIPTLSIDFLRNRLLAALGLALVLLASCGPDLEANVEVFDIELFEQNLQDALTGTNVGYAYAINQNGNLHATGAEGLARTAADGQPVAQSAFRRMNVASVSKPITAVAVLTLLEENNLTVDDAIAPYLPLHWSKGPNVAGLTFRDLLTHTSGLNGNANDDYAYADLQGYVAQGVNPNDKFYTYQNANFALFRVIIPYLWKGSFKFTDPSNYPQGLADLYVEYVSEHVLEPMGIQGASCAGQNDPTLLYAFPDNGAAGVDAGDWTLICGGGGWSLSAFELAAFLAHVRYGDVLSPVLRAEMNDGFLGWMEGWSSGNERGTYHSHNGLLRYSNATKGMSSVIMNYPNGVQVAVLVNSLNNGGTFVHQVVIDAYDGAWVWK